MLERSSNRFDIAQARGVLHRHRPRLAIQLRAFQGITGRAIQWLLQRFHLYMEPHYLVREVRTTFTFRVVKSMLSTPMIWRRRSIYKRRLERSTESRWSNYWNSSNQAKRRFLKWKGQGKSRHASKDLMMMRSTRPCRFLRIVICEWPRRWLLNFSVEMIKVLMIRWRSRSAILAGLDTLKTKEVHKKTLIPNYN